MSHFIAAQDAVEAEGGDRNDMGKVAWKLACALSTARRGVSFAFLRAGLYTAEPLKPLNYDDKSPLGIEEEGT